jgi:hypothetical protein
MKTLKQLANNKGYEVRNYNIPLKSDETFKRVMKPFEFSEVNGGTIDGFKYYNDFYLYPIINFKGGKNE